MKHHSTRNRRLEPRLAAVMSYMLGVFTGVILLRVERESRFVRFHALQSMFFSGVAIATLSLVLLAGFVTVSSWLFLGFAIVWFYAMYRAARGDLYRLPLVGVLAERVA